MKEGGGKKRQRVEIIWETGKAQWNTKVASLLQQPYLPGLHSQEIHAHFRSQLERLHILFQTQLTSRGRYGSWN